MVLQNPPIIYMQPVRLYLFYHNTSFMVQQNVKKYKDIDRETPLLALCSFIKLDHATCCVEDMTRGRVQLKCDGTQ